MNQQDFLRALERDPVQDRTPLDEASFYLERMKFGPTPGPSVKEVPAREKRAMMEALLREANVGAMSGEELHTASVCYGHSIMRGVLQAESWGVPLEQVLRELWLDGVMHGVALAAGLRADPPERQP